MQTSGLDLGDVVVEPREFFTTWSSDGAQQLLAASTGIGSNTMADAAPLVAVISKAVLNSAPDQLLSVPNLNLHNSQIVANENVGIVAGFTAHEQASLEGDITMDNSLRSISQTLSHSTKMLIHFFLQIMFMGKGMLIPCMYSMINVVATLKYYFLHLRCPCFTTFMQIVQD